MILPKAVYIHLVLTLLILPGCSERINSNETITSALLNVRKRPTAIQFENNQEVNNQGGHLQGIQLVSANNCEYALLTGSSDSYSYYAVVKLGDTNEVISVNKLMDKPFKHAGGFQIYQNYMAIGIEDNFNKNKSKVCIFNIPDPENPPVKPITIIERNGKALRSTAGCVGITKYRNKALVVVGDWDTKHLDFYSCQFSELESNRLKLIFTIDTEKIRKTDWVDDSWYSYQNINLITLNKNQLYLIGLGQNDQHQNIADLFSLTSNGSWDFNLEKIASGIFECSNETNFRAGAGVKWKVDEKLQIISCGWHIESHSFLNYFTN